MKKFICITYKIIPALLLLLFSACSGSEEDIVVVEEELEELKLYVSIPDLESSDSTQTKTRTGDPGTDTGEGIDWDRMAIILVYTEQPAYGSIVRYKIITKTEFEALPDLGSGYRQVSLYLPTGSVYVYGVTYSSGVTGDPEESIKACTSKANVEALTIPNNYASTNNDIDVAKFLSVATGYYQTEVLNDDGTSTGTTEQTTIYVNPPSQMTETFRMTLYRLATKIDIQWEAESAYSTYTDVEVSNFTYNGEASLTDDEKTATDSKGYGRLFPKLAGNLTNPSALGGSATFYNTSTISKRNGRQYHYVFPDGVEKPTITFTIDYSTATTTTPGTTSYTFQFQNVLQSATWYKVNTNITGITGKTSTSSQKITLEN